MRARRGRAPRDTPSEAQLNSPLSARSLCGERSGEGPPADASPMSFVEPRSSLNEEAGPGISAGTRSASVRNPYFRLSHFPQWFSRDPYPPPIGRSGGS
jgi:hypothetical protein